MLLLLLLSSTYDAVCCCWLVLAGRRLVALFSLQLQFPLPGYTYNLMKTEIRRATVFACEKINAPARASFSSILAIARELYYGSTTRLKAVR